MVDWPSVVGHMFEYDVARCIVQMMSAPMEAIQIEGTMPDLFQTKKIAVLVSGPLHQDCQSPGRKLLMTDPERLLIEVGQKEKFGAAQRALT